MISLFNFDRIRQSLFGSAAILTAVIGFAGQDVIKDILSGLQISIYRPFDIGDRIELEDGTVGIVESITMRHVVITRIDTLRTIIPNSKLNNYSILNYSYADIQRSMLLKFPVAYHSDIRRTKQVIADAVKASPFTIPGKTQPDGKKDYVPVYFISSGGYTIRTAPYTAAREEPVKESSVFSPSIVPSRIRLQSSIQSRFTESGIGRQLFMAP